MNLNVLSKEELIKSLKQFMMICINSFSINYIDWDTGEKNKVEFKKGEYYFYNVNEGGMWLKADNGEWFEWCDDQYMKTFESNLKLL